MAVSDPLGRAKQINLPTGQSVQTNYSNHAQTQSIQVTDPDAGTTEVFKRNSTRSVVPAIAESRPSNS